MAETIITIDQVSKRFGETVTAVDAVSLEIKQGEFFALLGPSGCGKTTLLRMIAGFEIPSDGAILIDGQNMAGIQPNHRPINMVFQSYAVFPHMSVADNVGYGLKVTGVDKAEIKQRAEESLELVKLGGYGARMPDQLSGGQRQRVALARALVKRPKVLLLDEPLSALDAKLREAMQLEMVRLQQSVGITFVIVTHDQNEALSMANRIAVMEAGRVRQVAAPAELYEFPNCRFVADFIGKMNLFEGQVSGVSGERVMVDVEGLSQLSLTGQGPASGAVGIAVRPEKVRLFAEPPADDLVALRGKVSEVAYFGDTSHVYVTDDKGRVISANLQNEARSMAPSFTVGQELWCAWRPDDSLLLTS